MSSQCGYSGWSAWTGRNTRPGWLLLLLAAVCPAQEDPAARIRAAMQASIQKQQASVERQRLAVRAQQATAQPAAEFFTSGWLPSTAFAVTAPLGCEPIPPEAIGPVVAEVAEREGLTPDLLRAVIEKESSYLPCAVSPKGAQGLMQLMPETAAGLGVEDPFDPRQNVDAGARFLRLLLDRYGGKLDLALAAYNAGPGRVDAVGRMPLIPETINYVSEILGKLRPAGP